MAHVTGAAVSPQVTKFMRRSCMKWCNPTWQGKSRAFHHLFMSPLEQMAPSVKWKSKEKQWMSKRNGGAGAAMLLTLRDSHGSRLLQGHILTLLDPVRLKKRYAADRLWCFKNTGAAVSRYSSQMPKWLWKFADDDHLCLIYSVISDLLTSKSKKNPADHHEVWNGRRGRGQMLTLV